MLANLVCLGRRTVTGLISTVGGQFKDWTAHYSLYSKGRVDPAPIFREVRRQVELLNNTSGPLCIALDDTIIHKTGKKIPRAAFRRDPLGPKFQVNLAFSHRWLQMSAAMVGPEGQSRMVPVAFRNASVPRKPSKSATPEQTEHYQEEVKQRNLNHLALDSLEDLQDQRKKENQGQTPHLHVLVDGSFTNSSILPNLPTNTTLIGRIRKDAKLYAKPTEQLKSGRRKIYGAPQPTPEQVRQDDRTPWQKIQIRHKGKKRELEVKTMTAVRWRPAKAKDLLIVVIRPVSYLKKKGARSGYTQPGYLVCTDPRLPLKSLLEEYLMRWDIEVNHRDEKTILGTGQAQVRNDQSVDTLPAMSVASYSMLLVAAAQRYGHGNCPETIPVPKWRKGKQARKKTRPSAQDLVNELRLSLWSDSIKAMHLNEFVHANEDDKKSIKSNFNLCCPLFNANA
jgi:hypothetical protein